MPADGSDTIDEYVFNGRALAFWRPIFLFGCWAFLIELVIFVGTLTFPNGAGDAVTSTPVVSALFSALSPLQPFWELFWAPLAALFAALVVLSLVSKIFYRDFSADGERAVQLYRLTREIDDLERELEPFDPTERARIRAAIKFASTAPPKVGGWVIELKAGLRKAMNDAQRRAFIQVVFGGCLALLGLLGLAALLYDTYQEYLKIAPGCGDGGCAAELNAVAAWRQELFLSLTTSKLLLALGGNGLSFFFLAGFRKSQADARYFRNELTTVEMREWAITESKASVPEPTDATVLVDILGRLGRADRNPIIPPGGSNGHILELRAMNDELRAILQAIRNRNQQGDASGAPA